MRAGYPGHYGQAGDWFSFDYALTSDDTGYKGGKLSYQPQVGVWHDTGVAGIFGASAWLDMYDFKLAEESGSGALHEGDYTAYWAYPIQPLSTAVELGWTARTFPQYAGDKAFTHEWYVLVSFDDSKLFGTKSCVLRPYVGYYRDMDDLGGARIEWGISHCFLLRELGLADQPVLRDIAVMPSLTTCIDDHQLSDSTRVASLRYGLDISYDLNSALGIDTKLGLFSIGGFLYYRQAFMDPVRNDLYGGLTLGYRL